MNQWTLPEKDWASLIPQIIQAAQPGDLVVCATPFAQSSITNFLQGTGKRLTVVCVENVGKAASRPNNHHGVAERRTPGKSQGHGAVTL